MADVAGMLVRLQLHFSEFDFDIVHRSGIKNRAAGSLSKPETERDHYANIDNDTTDALNEHIKNITEAIEAPSCTVCQTCDNNKQGTGSMMLEVQYQVQEQDRNRNSHHLW